MPNVWTPDMILVFRQLCDEQPELTFTVIADKMSKAFDLKITRNACIGKSHRLGIPARGKTEPRPVAKKKERTMVIKPVDAPIAPVFEPSPDHPDSVSLYQLGKGTCRWPLGETYARPPYRFCGCNTEIGDSYCHHHSAMAYNRPRMSWV